MFAWYAIAGLIAVIFLLGVLRTLFSVVVQINILERGTGDDR